MVEIDPHKSYIIIFKGTREEMHRLADQLVDLFRNSDLPEKGVTRAASFIIVNSEEVSDVLELEKFLAQLGFVKQ